MKALLLYIAISAGAADTADLVLRTGKIFLAPGRYASAVAVTGNRITAVGTDAIVNRYAGPKTKIIELRGRAVVPGFHDAHLHLMRGALGLTSADLTGSRNLAEIQQRVSDYTAANADAPWVFGRGWDQASLPGGKAPTAAMLDAVVSDRPVSLIDSSGRKMWVNTEALKKVGVSNLSKPKRGEIVRDGQGKATGLFLDEAMALVTRVAPQPDKQKKIEALKLALAQARQFGLTSIQSVPGLADGDPAELVELWMSLAQEGAATARLVVYGSLDKPKEMEALRAKAAAIPRTRLLLAGVMGFVDGVVASRTAALLSPYSDDREESGDLRLSGSSFVAQIRAAHALGLQVALHAAGDRAVRAALDACEAAQKSARNEGLVLPAFPCRIEAVELIHPAEVQRFPELRAAASMQPFYAVENSGDANYFPRRLGGRAANAFAWRTLESGGATLIFGSDWPSTPLDPRSALSAAAARQWMSDQRVSLETAIVHMTAGPAKACGLGEQLGEILPSRLADLVVLDRNVFAAPPERLGEASVALTIFDGRIVYDAANAK